MCGRGYNYRIHQKNRVVKRRVITLPFAKSYYNKRLPTNSPYGRSRRYSLGVLFQDPEDKWFNYLGEYGIHYDKKRGYYSYRGWYDNPWKEKYEKKRARLKVVTNKHINDEIRELIY